MGTASGDSGSFLVRACACENHAGNFSEKNTSLSDKSPCFTKEMLFNHCG